MPISKTEDIYNYGTEQRVNKLKNILKKYFVYFLFNFVIFCYFIVIFVF